jgi:uncharacterized ferritin-like protein (DUF455 family)
MSRTEKDSTRNLFAAAKACIDCKNPADKLELTAYYVKQWQQGVLSINDEVAPLPITPPGRPDKPKLVPPRLLARRRPGTEHGRAALIHAIAHIEFNAVNLAWDAVYRFRNMPEAYYADWVKVAGEEALHFSLLAERLELMGYQYGDFEAHDGLWEMACETAHDVMVRMALVPRVLEARGLDVTPDMIKRLQSAGDQESVAILEVILRDEIGHVEIGTRWFRYCCKQHGVDQVATFRELLQQYMKGQVKGPFHYQARLQAGFETDEMQDLERMAQKR